MGGVGGEGGRVSVCAVEGSNLSDIARRESRRFIGGLGGYSTSGRVFGEKGCDVTVRVPPGTVVRKDNGDRVSGFNLYS